MREHERSEDAEQTKTQRYGQILATLARHGIGIVDERDQSRAEHVRVACEELGATFIKLGQALSTRGDLLPQIYRDELMKLQDDVPPIPPSEIARVIREELGASRSEERRVG